MTSGRQTGEWFPGLTPLYLHTVSDHTPDIGEGLETRLSIYGNVGDSLVFFLEWGGSEQQVE